MPQRHGQNPIKSVKDFSHRGKNPYDPSSRKSQTKGTAPLCPVCHTEVPPKPGFRLSSLKCPKCGASMSKK